MAVVTIHGHIGTRGHDVGVTAARLLDADFVDRLVLAESAKRIGSTVEVLEIKGERRVAFKDRLAYFLQTMLERSAMSGAGGEPYFSPGMEYFPSEEYPDLAQEPLTAAQRLNDQHFIEVTGSVIKDLATAGDVVIVGRGSNMILKDMPGVLHVGLIDHMEQRVANIREREHLNKVGAEKYITEMEKERVSYFRKFFKAHPDDPSLYHMMLNLGTLRVQTAAEIVAHAAKDVAAAVQLKTAVEAGDNLD